MALLLGQSEVARQLQMEELIPALELAQMEYSQGKSVQPTAVAGRRPDSPLPGELR